ncbi:MAG: glycosyltransferase [Flavobacteriales bacterium]
MSSVRITLATPSRHTWSETFIAAHIAGLKDVVLVLSDGTLPYSANGSALLTPRNQSERLRFVFERRIRKKGNAALLRDRITKQLRNHRTDVLLAEYGPTAEKLIDSAREAGVPLVAHFHGYDAHKLEILERYGNYKRLFHAAAAIVVVSRAMERQMLALGAPREHLHYIVYGTDTERFTSGDPATNPPHFVAVGRFTDKKAPQLTLLAFRKAWRKHPQARLTMAGAGPLWEAVRQLVQSYGMEAVVDLPGVLPPEQVAARLRRARAFVQHSLTPSDHDMEGTPLAVLEAMASGLAVISTLHAGIPDVVAHGKRGLLSAEYDIDAMAAHIIQLIEHPDQAAAMGQAGRAYVSANHRIEDRIGVLQQLLEQVVAEHHRV